LPFANDKSATPIIVLERNANAPERWREVYGVPLVEQEREWKEMLAESSCSAEIADAPSHLILRSI
jgi:hypothetical protein